MFQQLMFAGNGQCGVVERITWPKRKHDPEHAGHSQHLRESAESTRRDNHPNLSRNRKSPKKTREYAFKLEYVNVRIRFHTV